jgi:hypothetical protein
MTHSDSHRRLGLILKSIGKILGLSEVIRGAATADRSDSTWHMAVLTVRALSIWLVLEESLVLVHMNALEALTRKLSFESGPSNRPEQLLLL